MSTRNLRPRPQSPAVVPGSETSAKPRLPSPYNKVNRELQDLFLRIKEACGEWPWKFLKSRAPKTWAMNMTRKLARAVEQASEYGLILALQNQLLHNQQISLKHVDEAFAWISNQRNGIDAACPRVTRSSRKHADQSNRSNGDPHCSNKSRPSDVHQLSTHKRVAKKRALSNRRPKKTTYSWYDEIPDSEESDDGCGRKPKDPEILRLQRLIDATRERESFFLAKINEQEQVTVSVDRPAPGTTSCSIRNERIESQSTNSHNLEGEMPETIQPAKTTPENAIRAQEEDCALFRLALYRGEVSRCMLEVLAKENEQRVVST